MNWYETHALVTGGTRGIGLELVTQLLDKGAKVTATGTTESSLAKARALLPQVTWLALDQAEATSRDALTLALPVQGISLVIHNAGVQQMRNWTATDTTVVFNTAQEMAVNFVGPAELTRLLLPRLAREPHAQVVFVTSGLALAPKSSSPVYCASKAALRSFAKSLRAQVQQAGWPVLIQEALPPLVDTDMTRGRGKGKISAADAASQILHGAAKGRLEIDVGATGLLRFILRLSPTLGERIMIGR
jgi:uncharacterized oxidoreductase